MSIIYNGIFSCDTDDLATGKGVKYNGIFSVNTDVEDAVSIEGVSSTDAVGYTIAEETSST